MNHVTLLKAQAAHSRDTLCKSLYQRLFAWVAAKVNTSIAVPKKDTKAVIGVLDIYGFEIFTKNGFEQFCINYCNEKLQQLFIELTLKSEQDEYTAEGIKWTPIVYFNNKVICDLVDAKSGGIVRTLEDEGNRPGDKSDATWLKSLNDACGKHDHLQIASGPGDKSIAQDAFVIKHYAGDVTYNIDGFLDKNTDTLFKDIARLMFKSSNPVMTECFPEVRRSFTCSVCSLVVLLGFYDVAGVEVRPYVSCYPIACLLGVPSLTGALINSVRTLEGDESTFSIANHKPCHTAMH
jgi:myosin-1